MQDLSLQANSHQRFAVSLSEYHVEQDLGLYFVKLESHLQVLLTLKRQEKDYNKITGLDAQIELLKRERDTWMLLELLWSPENESIAIENDLPTWDQAVLESELRKSPSVRLLHKLIRWTHLIHAENTVSSSEVIDSNVEDLIENNEESNKIWNLIRAGALYFVKEESETREMNKILREAFTKNKKHAWRYASLVGGRPYEMKGNNNREGNAHRANWKLACRSLAEKTHSEMESAIYSIISGERSRYHSVNVDTVLWMELRTLSESWSDYILQKHHLKHSQLIEGRTRGEAYEESEKFLVEDSNLDTSHLETNLKESILRGFAQSRRAANATDLAKFFLEVQEARVSDKLAQFLEQQAGKEHEGDRLRFLAHLCIYSWTVEGESRPPNEFEKRLVKKYVDYLSKSKQISEIPPYLKMLERDTSLEISIKSLQMGTLSSDQDRVEILRRLNLSINLLSEPNLFNLWKIQMLSQFDFEFEGYSYDELESYECSQRRRHFGVNICDSDYWKESWKMIEFWRWIVLLQQLIPEEDVSLRKIVKEFMLQFGNRLVQEAIHSYLTEQNEANRVLNWKMGEVLLALIGAEHVISLSKNAVAEYTCWKRIFEAWKILVVLQLDIEKIDFLENANNMNSHSNSEREKMVIQATEQVTNTARHLVTEFQNALESQVESENMNALVLRNKYLGKLIVETFDKLGSAAKRVNRIKKDTRLIDDGVLCRLCLSLIVPVGNEVIKRKASNSETDEFRIEIKTVLEIVEHISKVDGFIFGEL